MRSLVASTAVSFLAIASVGCVGSVGETEGDGSETVSPGSGGSPGKDPGGRGGTTGTSVGPGLIDSPKPGGGANAACKGGVPATPRVVRLTRRQYENSLRALTGLKDGLAGDLPLDPALAGFNRGNDLEVSDLIGRVYRDQAESVARQVVSSPASLKQVVGCETKDDACAMKFITGFGVRTFRRPLTDAETKSYFALFKKGDELGDVGDAFTKGVQVTVEAMLQSPRFLYRAETSVKKDGALIALSGYEIAQRLSFTLANTTPDAELLEAASKNDLSDPQKVVAHARRLLATPEGRATLRDFSGQWMGTNEWEEKFDKVNYKDMKTLLPKFEEELDLFVEEVTFKQGKGLATLLTAPFTFVDKQTAAYYGVMPPVGTGMTKVELDPTKRAGILTQVGFLASHAYSNRSSPIHRGVAIGRRLLCSTIPDPVANVAPLPPAAAGKTMRQIVTEHTAAAGCRECHVNFINPLGFGLENYDEAGKWRDRDNMQPVDATGTLVGTAGNVAFKNGVELAKAIVEAPESRTCYAKQWFRYAFGREETEADACAIQTLAGSLAKDSYTTVDLLVDMTRTQAFMFRSAEAQ